MTLFTQPPPVLYQPPKNAPIPVIDVDRVRPIDEVAAEFRAAAVDMGFLYVKNHGINPSVRAAAFDAVQRFFALPLEAKERVPRTGGMDRGWEGLEKQRNDTASAPDYKESWNFSLRSRPSTRPPNKWPAEFSDHEFREPLMTYYLAVAGVGDHLMRVFARSLDLPVDYFDEMFRDGIGSIRTLFYPPHPKNAKFNQLGAGAHTDAGVLTLLAQDDAGGLEVQSAQGEWLSAQVIPDTLVVNLGDCAQRWTNDLYRSTKHRVMNANSGRDRYSMAYFHGPKYDTLMECIPSCLAPGEVAKYEPISIGDYTTARLARKPPAPGQE
jgi:isopenicillin N synthase-like dioxygenase